MSLEFYHIFFCIYWDEHMAFSYNLLMQWITRIQFLILKYCCIPELHLTCLWYSFWENWVSFANTGITWQHCRCGSRPLQWSEYHNEGRQMNFLVSQAYKSYIYSISHNTVRSADIIHYSIRSKKSVRTLIKKTLLLKKHLSSSKLSVITDHRSP